MTDAELDAWLAVNAMGWHRGKTPHTSFWYIAADGTNTGWLANDWSPRTDARCTEVLMARLTEPRMDPQDRTRGWRISIKSSPSGWYATLSEVNTPAGYGIFTAVAPDWKDAVCQAAKKALEESNDS